MKALIRHLIEELRPIRRPARVLYLGAAFWMVSALVHLVALGGDGWTWSGAVSFRKPLTFSISVGLLMATVGWVLDRLPDRPRLAGALAWTFLVSSSVEVGLIAVQAWRGRASHFNVMEADDAAIFALMGTAVGFMSLCLLGLLIWSLIERPADPSVKMAVIAGLLLVTTGLGIGQWIITLGVDYVETRGAVPETVTFGRAGVAKFPHAIAFHGIQLFILAAVTVGGGSNPAASKRGLMRLVVTSYTAILVFASLQTVAGRTPTDPSVWSLGLAVSLVLLATALTQAARGFIDRESMERVEPAKVA
ncbi:MAG TPA: hypothetical protein VMS99_12360 [Acidimicrobiia bacterium]|nr:hypothetical protein [Acidimicrobiia bacterium]